MADADGLISTKMHVRTRLHVTYSSLTDFIRRAFSDPVQRSSLRFGVIDPGDGPVSEFNQTPFVREHLRYSSLVDFHRHGKRYSVGDFVRFTTNRGIFRIEKLSYQCRELGLDDLDVRPPLMLTCSQWSRKSGQFYGPAPRPPSQFPADDVREVDMPIRAHDRKPMFCYQEVIDGTFVWIEIFVDSFGLGTSKSGAGSTGIYAAISNTRRDVRHVQSFVYTLFLLPPGVDPMSVMWVISRDLVKLQNGYNVFDSATQTWQHVKGAVSQLIADHAQALKTTRALGNNAHVTGRCCWVAKNDRLKSALLKPDNLVSCIDHTHTRRDAQTDVCVRQMRFTLGARPNQSLTKRIQARYGVCLAPRPFLDGVELDTHVQSFWDGSHIFWHNIVPRLLCKFNTMASKHGKGRSSASLLFRSRMNLFPWRRALGGRCSAPWRPSMGRSVSLSQWKIFLLVATFASHGLGLQVWHALIVDFWKLSCLVFASTGLSCDQVKEAQTLCLTCIRTFLKLGGTKKNSDEKFFDLPCLHGLWELCFRTLPAMRNGNFSKVDSFETHHRVSKIQGAGAMREEYSIRNLIVHDGLVRVLHGMRWGDKEQFSLGPAWTANLLRHPVFVALTPFSGKKSSEQEERWSATAGWVSGSLTTEHELEIHRAIRGIDTTVDVKSDVKLRLIAGFRRFHKSITETICPGDTVCVLFDNEPAWAALQKPFVEASWGKDEVRLFAFPTWYTNIINNGGEPRTHAVRNTVLLRRFVLPNIAYPLEAQTIIERVHIIHSCKRACNIPGHVNCHCHPNCYVKFFCSVHDQEDCPACPFERHVAKDYHNPERDLYEVLTNLHGLQFEKLRGQYIS